MPLRSLMSGGSFAVPVYSGVLTAGSISTITDDTKYNAWPSVIRLANNDLLVSYTKGDSHHADNTGKAVVKKSTDSGATWGSEVTIYDDPSLWTSVLSVAQISTGRVFATLFRDNQAVSGTGQSGLSYSDDNGATWTTWATLTNGFTQESYGAGPVIELAGGDLLVTIEGSNSGQAILNRSSHTLRSTDRGLTWGSEVTVRNYVTDTRPYYESCLVRLDNGTLLCIHRTSGGTGTHYISTSSDSGATWGAPASAFSGYGMPHTIQTGWGTLIVVTRRNSDAACVAYTSLDRGATWSSAVALDATMTEMEYGCPVQTLDNRILVVYGSQPSAAITNSDIKQIYVTEGHTP